MYYTLQQIRYLLIKAYVSNSVQILRPVNYNSLDVIIIAKEMVFCPVKLGMK